MRRVLFCKGRVVVSIQWFPGHMAKARREMEESLRLVDVVIELRDARIPLASGNPAIREILHVKPTVIALAKSDLADPEQTAAFARFLEGDRAAQVIPINALRGTGVPLLVRAAQEATAAKLAKLAARGIRRQAVRAMVVGVPNAGKSALINRLAGRAATATGDRPGITRQQQWIRVGTTFELLDTPGILWPKFEDPKVGLRLAWTGAIKATLLDTSEVASKLLEWLRSHYPTPLAERYRLSDLEQPAHDLLVEIALARGALRQGGQPDVERAAEMLLRDLQTGALGPLTLERVSGD
jgi:ribosome biogenesis GTPase A